MDVITSLSRSEQKQRRLNAYKYYKDLSAQNSDKKRKKESIYQEVANKYGYANVTSVKTVIRQLAQDEEEQIKKNLEKATGIIETILCYEDLLNEKFSKKELDVRYNLKISANIDIVMIEGTYNSKSQRAGFFDHFSVVDVPAAISRITNLLMECNSKFY